MIFKKVESWYKNRANKNAAVDYVNNKNNIRNSF